ncbi:hypothetical protein PspLS_11053 [Pyricularia sp. CBS 133598]|nr:hypothetical protein PspLS_11053 [Pyricularia sp. CBS 133598]
MAVKELTVLEETLAGYTNPSSKYNGLFWFGDNPLPNLEVLHLSNNHIGEGFELIQLILNSKATSQVRLRDRLLQLFNRRIDIFLNVIEWKSFPFLLWTPRPYLEPLPLLFWTR